MTADHFFSFNHLIREEMIGYIRLYYHTEFTLFGTQDDGLLYLGWLLELIGL